MDLAEGHRTRQRSLEKYRVCVALVRLVRRLGMLVATYTMTPKDGMLYEYIKHSKRHSFGGPGIVFIPESSFVTLFFAQPSSVTLFYHTTIFY